MPLTAFTIRKLKLTGKRYRVHDADGLYLEVSPTGTMSWRYKYRTADGREKTLTLGNYPEVSLAEARDRLHAARRLRAAGIDPSAEKQRLKRQAEEVAASTFAVVAADWQSAKKAAWASDRAHKVKRALEMHVLPSIGSRPIAQILPGEVRVLIKKVEDAGHTEMSHFVYQVCAAVFQFGIADSRSTFNPALSLKGTLAAHRSKRMPSLPARDLPDLLNKVDALPGLHPVTRIAVNFLVLTIVRPGEMRNAQWKEIDWQAKEWRIPAERMKMREEHIVPLSRQAVALLKQLKPLTGNSAGGYLFPNQQRRRNLMMSENTINHALRRVGYAGKMVAHGFRSMASTALNETGLFRPDVIERQLAHAERNSSRASYNFAQYLIERRKLMQGWADLVDQLRRPQRRK